MLPRKCKIHWTEPYGWLIEFWNGNILLVRYSKDTWAECRDLFIYKVQQERNR